VTRFPRDVPKRKVIKALERQAGISREEFIEVFNEI